MGTIIDLPQPSGTILSTQILIRNLNIKAFSSSPPSFSNSICIPSSPGVFPLFIFPNVSTNSSSVIPSSSTPSSFLSSTSLYPSSSGCTSTFSNSSKYSIQVLCFSSGLTNVSPFLSLILHTLLFAPLYVLANLKIFFLPSFISSISSFASFSATSSFALLFTLSASFLASTYTALDCTLLFLSHLLNATIFCLTAFFTCSFHQGVCFFLTPPIHLMPRVSLATSFTTLPICSIVSSPFISSIFSFTLPT